MASRNSSRDCRTAISLHQPRQQSGADKIIAARNSDRLASRDAQRLQDLPPAPISAGSMIISGTTSQVLRDQHADHDPARQRPHAALAIRVLRMTIVLESEISAPNQSDLSRASRTGCPIAVAEQDRQRHLDRRADQGDRADRLQACLSENSRPRANSSSATPISASSSMSWVSVTARPIECGPTSTPARM